MVVGVFVEAVKSDVFQTFPAGLAEHVKRDAAVVAEAVALAAGATRMPMHQFLLLCASGNAIYAIVLCGNGAALVPDALVGPGLVLPMLLPVLAWLIWHAMSRHEEPPQ